MKFCDPNSNIALHIFLERFATFLLSRLWPSHLLYNLLNVEPYDIVSGGDIFLCYYNYRLLERKIPIANSNKNRSINDLDSQSLNSELSQITGAKFYTEWKKLYVFFKDGKLASFITSDGLKDANYLMLVNGSIKLLSDDLVFISLES